MFKRGGGARDAFQLSIPLISLNCINELLGACLSVEESLGRGIWDSHSRSQWRLNGYNGENPMDSTARQNDSDSVGHLLDACMSI